MSERLKIKVGDNVLYDYQYRGKVLEEAVHWKYPDDQDWSDFLIETFHPTFFGRTKRRLTWVRAHAIKLLPGA